METTKMFNKGDDQRQELGSGSTALQAKGDITINNGVSYSDVREIVLDMFRANFLQLSGDAMEAARHRAEEITDKFLAKLIAENLTGLDQAKSPDFQYALYTVQRDYARAADADLGDLLVDLLVDRTKHPKRNLAQIVLNECLSVAPKITSAQLSNLSVIFYLKYCNKSDFPSLKTFVYDLDVYLLPFVNDLLSKRSDYQHLEFAGCGSSQITTTDLAEILWNKYQGIFDKGINALELSGASFFFNSNQKLVGPCCLDGTKVQVMALNKPHLETLLAVNKVSKEDAVRLRNAFGKNRLSSEEIRSKCIAVRPEMEKLFSAWNSTELHNFTLTSVGMGLGHANLKRLGKDFGDLSNWVG